MVMGRRPDTLEEAEIRKQIDAKNIKGLSPRMVLRIPKTELEPMVLQGMRDHEICKVFQVSHGVIGWLRKYYDLPFVSDVLKMLECLEPDETELQEEPEQKVTSHPLAEWPIKKVAQEPTIEEALIGEPVEDVPTYAATKFESLICEAAKKLAEKQVQEFINGTAEPSVVPVGILAANPEAIKRPEMIIRFDLTETGKITYGIVAGVARMLKEMDGERVEVIVVVRRV